MVHYRIYTHFINIMFITRFERCVSKNKINSIYNKTQFKKKNLFLDTIIIIVK